MSLFYERGDRARPGHRLDGRERLVDPANPEICKVKGVMFAARERFVKELFGEEEFQRLLASLPVRTRACAEAPLAATWYDFESLVEYDRAIHARFGGREPRVLALLGAASVEYALTTVYKALDAGELARFLNAIPKFHTRFQKFGRVVFTPGAGGGQMAYYDYVCYSPIFCASAIGFYMEVLLRHGGRNPRVEERKCHCRGDDVCLFDLRWS